VKQGLKGLRVTKVILVLEVYKVPLDHKGHPGPKQSFDTVTVSKTVHVVPDVSTNPQFASTTIEVHCPEGTKVVSGGSTVSASNIGPPSPEPNVRSGPVGIPIENGWQVTFDYDPWGPEITFTVFAICGELVP
jgi:hypothetical protein